MLDTYFCPSMSMHRQGERRAQQQQHVPKESFFVAPETFNPWPAATTNTEMDGKPTQIFVLD
jgi:hypothetical protein